MPLRLLINALILLDMRQILVLTGEMRWMGQKEGKDSIKRQIMTFQGDRLE
jgi:hypothetical protein